MKRAVRKRRSGEQGAAAIEFALVLPLLIILFFGIIEFSVILYDKAMITNASREGARVGIVYRFDAETETSSHPSDDEIRDTINNYIQNHLISLGASSTADIPAPTRSGNAAGDTLTVTVNYDYHFLVLSEFITTLTGPITLSATTVMRME
jgi:Flp pilus assembly protein TadG